MDTLLPRSEPRAAGSRILREAAFLGDLRMVRQLLPFCDPNARHSAALQDAAVCGEAEIVELLLPVSDARAAWRELERKFRKWKTKDTSKLELAIGLEALCEAATEKDL